MAQDTSNSSAETYQVQDLPDRYIKSRVLEDYIAARLDEFGSNWSLQVGFGTKTLQAKALIRV
jgi:hypothetical protein